MRRRKMLRLYYLLLTVIMTNLDMLNRALVILGSDGYEDSDVASIKTLGLSLASVAIGQFISDARLPRARMISRQEPVTTTGLLPYCYHYEMPDDFLVLEDVRVAANEIEPINYLYDEGLIKTPAPAVIVYYSSSLTAEDFSEVEFQTVSALLAAMLSPTVRSDTGLAVMQQYQTFWLPKCKAISYSVNPPDRY